jgi:transposase
MKGLRRMTQGQEEGRENSIQPIRASVFHSSPNLKVLREQCSEALHILDRFHIMVKMNQALDDVRAEESRRVPREGHEPVLKKPRWLLLNANRISPATSASVSRLSSLACCDGFFGFLAQTRRTSNGSVNPCFSEG